MLYKNESVDLGEITINYTKDYLKGTYKSA